MYTLYHYYKYWFSLKLARIQKGLCSEIIRKRRTSIHFPQVSNLTVRVTFSIVQYYRC